MLFSASMRATVLGVMVIAAGCAKSTGTPAAPDAPIDTAMVSISPTTPHAGDDLHAIVTNPASEDYKFRWSVDGTVRTDLTGLDVPATNTHRDQRWEVDLLNGAGVQVSTAMVTILDTAPTMPVVSITAMPTCGDAIQCVVTTPSTDVDGDTVTYSATWTKNAQPLDGAVETVFTADTVPGALTAAVGDTYVCTVIASDGEMMSTATASTMTVLPGPVTFGYTGASQTYTVPPCVQQITIAAYGAQGASAFPAMGQYGGMGGYAQGNMPVTAGMVLDVEVGGQSGYNGGGAGSSEVAVANGGGASDVRVGGNALVNRVIVAGGGGGGGCGDAPGKYVGGAGGGGTCGANYCGGGGGAGYQYPANGNGGAGGSTGGTAITQAHAGGGGGGGLSSGGGGSCETYYSPERCGGAGALGQGGVGDGGGQGLHSPDCYSSYAGGTAGGGGGYYGGGGSSVGFCGGGGGGGGSSYVGSLTAATMTAGQRAGDGQITITPY